LWKNYLSQALNTGSYSDEQLSLIKESFRFLTPGFFENTITQSGDLFEIWKFKVTKIFSERLKTATFNDLLDSGSFNLTVSVNNPPVSLVVPADCECNTSGDFCGNNNYNIGPFCVVTHKCNTG